MIPSQPRPDQPVADTALDELLKLARELALAAGHEHVVGRQAALEVRSKSSPTDLVSQVDRRAEEVIVRGLLAARPNDGLIAEEGSNATGSSGVRWVIDPLDGTTNYVYGYPASCVSIAAEIDGVPQVGVVYEPPGSGPGRLYEAVAGRRATRDGRPIAVRSHAVLAAALVATGFSYDAGRRVRQAAALTHILPRIRDIRRAGSAALDLCRVADGQVDAFWELGLQPWDHAAGTVIARAAGADVRTMAAAADRGLVVVAACPALMPALVELLAEAGVVAAEALD